MADHSNPSLKAGELQGRAQVKKDEMISRATDAAHSCKQSCQESMQQAGGSLQQVGEQMKSMAQGSADAVKNAMSTGNNSSGARGGGSTGC
ncbi:hypothetical protein Taro_013772 [Colocasia esculenta]|uniref:Uncharacterized protein n=1 Tax=Colocasia esculenta TaxID=4460 RepID=A0A843UJR5_COLES|nr:hypothetical protein [Colocasia esculenta]